MNQIWAFAAFAAILAITPGLDTMLVLRTAASGGRRAGLAAVSGVALGCLVWAVASALGVTAVLSASRLAFDVLRIAGAAYLCWLGVSTLWRARRSAVPSGPAVVSPAARDSAVAGDFASRMDSAVGWESAAVSESAGAAESGADRATAGPAGPSGSGAAVGRWGESARGLRLGFTTNLLNPKVGVFYLSVIPQFLPSGMHPLAGSLLLAAIHMLAGLLWLSLVVLIVHRARGWFNRPAVRRRLQQLAGVAFLGFGLRLALTPDLR